MAGNAGSKMQVIDADSAVEQAAECDEELDSYMLGIESRIPTEMWRLTCVFRSNFDDFMEELI